MDRALQVLSDVGHFALQLQAANLLNTPLSLCDNNNERQIARSVNGSPADM
jgi:hypothetical protein